MSRKTQLLVGVLSAALLFNGTIMMAPSAFADDDNIVVVKPPLNSKQLTADWLRLLVVRASTVAGKDLSDLQDGLAAGQNLVQASGLSASDLSGGLMQLADQTVANAAGNYTAEAGEIDRLREEIRSLTLEALTISGYNGGSVQAFHFDSVLNDRLASLNAIAMALSGDEYDDIVSRLQGGANLVQATGVPESELAESILEPVIQQIEQAAGKGAITSEEAAKYKEAAGQAVREGLQAPGGSTVQKKSSASNFNGEALIKQHAASIIEEISLFTPEYDANELRYALETGTKLAEVTGISKSELISNLSGLWSRDIEAAYKDGLISEKVKDELCNQINMEVEAAISSMY